MSTVAAFSTTAPSGSDGHWKVAGDTTPQLILSASQDERAHASIFNDSNSNLYIRFGAGPVNVLSPTGSFDVKLPAGSLYELPKPIWQGEIWGIWDHASGCAHVLELGDND